MFSYFDHLGKQRWATASTLREAQIAREDLRHSKGRGRGGDELLAVWLREWVERYQGRGRRGFREETRAEYRRDIERYIVAISASARSCATCSRATWRTSWRG